MGNCFTDFNQKPIIIAFEGNIGAGKSTFINYLKKNMTYLFGKKVIYIEEPLHLWQNLGGVDMLKKFYSNQEKYAFEFQMLATISRLKMLEESIKINKNVVYVIERCVLSDYHIFTKMLSRQSKMNEQQQIIINMWFSHIKINIDYIVYLKTSPVNAYNRCRMRNRKGETVEFDYIDSCHNMYESWLNKETSNLITLDCDNHMSDHVYQDHITTIKNNIKNFKTFKQMFLEWIKIVVVAVIYIYFWYVFSSGFYIKYLDQMYSEYR